MKDPEDRAWIQSALGGDEGAFTSLYQKHHLRLTLSLTRLAQEKDRDKVEDVVQETFATAFLKLDRFKGESEFFTWLYRIAINGMLMKKRRSKREDASTVSYDALLLDPEQHRPIEWPIRDQQLEGIPDRLTVRKVLQRLAPGYRKCLVLHYFHNYLHREIAQELGCTIGTSKSQLHKAKGLLRPYLVPRNHSHKSPTRYTNMDF